MAKVHAVLHQAAHSSPLTIPTYPADNDEVVHPSVVDAGADGWNGYRWWMAATPYPDTDDKKENPSIWCSHDKVTWIVPPGATNPVEPEPSIGYNSDPEIVLDDGTLHLFWRYVGSNIIVKHRASTDGATWTSPVTVVSTANGSGPPMLSPAILKGADGTWRMWAIDQSKIGSGLGGMELLTSSSPTSGWVRVGMCNLTAPAGQQLWHSHFAEQDGRFLALVMLTNAEGGGGRVHVARTTDGLTFTMDDLPMLAGRPGHWDAQIYRSCWVPRNDPENVWDVWYSGQGSEWRVAHTTVDL